MLKIALNGVNQVREEMEKIQKQIPFASAMALTRTARLVQAEIEREMASVFDRPTKWTLNSLRLFPAKKTKLEAKVWMKDEADKSGPASRWLRPEIDGGQRPDKRSETLLRNKGVLPSGKYIMPGKKLRLDRFGNVSKGTMQKVLSGLGAQNDRYQNSTGSRRSKANSKQYFVLGRGQNAIGIAERTSKRNIKMVLAFGSRPSYSRRLDFYGIGQRVADENLEREFEAAIAYALRHSNYRTARGGKLRTNY